MKTVEELKKEQYDLKAKLHELVEFMNDEEFFTLNDARKKMYNNLKVGVEMQLKCLSIMVHEDLDNPITVVPDFGWIGLMLGTFMGSSFNIPLIKATTEELNTKIKDGSHE